MNHLRKIGLASFLFLALGLCSGAFAPQVLGATADTAFIIALICHGIGLVLALVAFKQSRRGQSLDGVTKFLARGPLGLITLIVLFFFLRAMTGI